MNPEYQNLLRSSFDEYLGLLDTSLVPDDQFLTYEYPYITDAKWRFMADSMIQDELQEVTNRMHEWRDMLRRWHAWNKVVSTREQTLAWDVRREFMQPLMHNCLMMPSAVRDLITFVGTNALHQLRLHAEPGYADVLEGDPSATDPSPRPLTRRRKESRLNRLAAPLNGSVQFIEGIRQIDSNGYRAETKDYRNLNSHAIGPRIALGQTNMVTRQAVPATRMEAQPDGTVRVAEIPGRYVASYSLGGLEPLDLEAARTASLGQYNASRVCFGHFTALLQSHCAKLPRADA
jgi:hypothetical protein